MPLQDVFQLCFVDISLLEQLFDADPVFGPPDAGGNGDDVFGLENSRRDAFVIDPLRFAHRFLGQTVGGEKLDRKSAQ
jgi:hypothetical protein